MSDAMEKLRRVDLGGYSLCTWRSVWPDIIEYEIVTSAGTPVRRGHLRWSTSKLSSEVTGQKKKQRSIDSDASLRAILNVVGNLEPASNLYGSDDYVAPDNTLKQFYADYANRICQLASGDQPFLNVDDWTSG
jgi:hypothetical protein